MFYPRARNKEIREHGHTGKLLLEIGSDISIVNEQTWKKIGCPPLKGTKK